MKEAIPKIKKSKAYKLASLRACTTSSQNYMNTANILARNILKIGKTVPFNIEANIPKKNNPLLCI